MQTTDLLQTRQSTHGDFHENAIYAQQLRALFRTSPKWPQIHPVQREALDNLATKLSRILSGQAECRQHWEDVAGYAHLALDACLRD